MQSRLLADPPAAAGSVDVGEHQYGIAALRISDRPPQSFRYVDIRQCGIRRIQHHLRVTQAILMFWKIRSSIDHRASVPQTVRPCGMRMD